MEKYLKDFHVIIKADIYLPPEYAYILTTIKDNKCGFLSGTFNVSVCTPEIEFIRKHGKILKVYELAIYEKAPIFKEYVEFFYKHRWEFKDANNFIFEQFCKLLMNGLYGKFGQHDSNYEVLTKNAEFDLGRYEIKEEKNGKVSEYIVMHVGNSMVKVENTDDNAYDSFVAVASMVTSYARMYLIELILKVGRDNVYYVDTDSLIINSSASHKLKSLIDNRKLGYLKFEGSSMDSEFIRPKWYRFGEEMKCKGVKKDAEIIADTGEHIIIVQDQWERFKTSISKKHVDRQIIKPIFKVLDKKYDKGKVDKNGYVHPFKVLNKGVSVSG